MITLNTGLTIGADSPVRINCNIGCNSKSDYKTEVEKLLQLKQENMMPDLVMDLSLVDLPNPLYRTVRDEMNLPFGTVLSYHGFDKSIGLQWETVRSRLIHLCEEGISFVTIHYTADLDLLDKAKQSRIIPITSRGGGIVLYDTRLNNRQSNIFREHISEIVDIVLHYDVAISLGATFRPGSILDACDDIHIEETKRQLVICRYLKERNVKVIVENVGHISLTKMAVHADLLKQFDSPIMPLGPLPTDVAINEDHVSNAIGGVFASYLGAAHILNCVTRYEHSHSRIDVAATIEAIRAARVAAQIVNASHGIREAMDKEFAIASERAKLRSCFADGSSCSRCSGVCPLKLV